MPEKSWSQIVTELRGLKNEILAMEDDPDVEFLGFIDCLDCVIDGLEFRYIGSVD